MTPQVSVIIAVHNAEAWLSACLDSLLRQTEARWQAVCVDDASTDGSAGILKRYADADARFMVLTLEHNEGQAAARNRAIPHLEGDWTLMLDADDWLADNALELLLAAAQHRPAADCLLMQLDEVFPDKTRKHWETGRTGEAWSGTEALHLSLGRELHGLYAARTEFFRIWPFDASARLYSDDNTAHIHYMHAREVVSTGATYYYRRHALSTTQRWTSLRLCMLEANRSLRSMLEDEDADALSLRLAEKWIWHNFVGTWRALELHRDELGEAELSSARERFRAALGEMRPLRLPLRDWLRPAYVFMRPLGAFEHWQRLLMRLSRK